MFQHFISYPIQFADSTGLLWLSTSLQRHCVGVGVLWGAWCWFILALWSIGDPQTLLFKCILLNTNSMPLASLNMATTWTSFYSLTVWILMWCYVFVLQGLLEAASSLKERLCSFPNRPEKARRSGVAAPKYCTLLCSKENVGNGEEKSEDWNYSLTAVV